MATRDDRPVSRHLLIAGTCAMILALLGVLAGTSAAPMPAGQPLERAALSLAPPDLAAEGRDGHGVTASIFAERSGTVAAFVRTWDDRPGRGETFLAAGPHYRIANAVPEAVSACNASGGSHDTATLCAGLSIVVLGVFPVRHFPFRRLRA
jgi:hypothetical protein